MPLTNRQLKLEGKQSMMQTMPLWFRAILFFVGAQLFLEMSKRWFGGALGWYLIPIDKLPDAVSGFTLLENGFELIVRMDVMNVTAVVSLTYLQIAIFLLANAVVLALLAPAKLGTMNCCWRSFRGEHTGDFSPVGWYRKPKLFAKAVGVSFLVDGLCRVLGFLLTLPGLALSLYLCMSDWMQPGAAIDMEFRILSLLSLLLTLCGIFLAFALYSLLYPLVYCLAAQPDYSLAQIWKKGLASTKGVRWRFIGYRLGFVPWYLLSSFTVGVADLYVMPYISFASFRFLQEAAQDKAIEQTA